MKELGEKINLNPNKTIIGGVEIDPETLRQIEYPSEDAKLPLKEAIKRDPIKEESFDENDPAFNAQLLKEYPYLEKVDGMSSSIDEDIGFKKEWYENPPPVDSEEEPQLPDLKERYEAPDADG